MASEATKSIGGGLFLSACPRAEREPRMHWIVDFEALELRVYRNATEKRDNLHKVGEVSNFHVVFGVFGTTARCAVVRMQQNPH